MAKKIFRWDKNDVKPQNNNNTNKTQTDFELFERIIKEFCDILLNKMDVADLNCYSKELSFFEENERYKVLTHKEHIDYFNSNLENMRNVVEHHCFLFVHSKSNANPLYTPYSFYEYPSMIAYETKLKDYFNKKFKSVSFPEYFPYIITWVSNRAEEFKVFAEYAQNKINLSNERSSEELKKRSQDLQTNITCVENKLKTAETNVGNIQSDIERVNKSFESIEDSIDAAKEAVGQIEKTTKDNIMQTSISVLGVFSAVVLTFNMGISFAAEALNAFMQSSSYHSILVILLFGFIIGNVIFALFAFIKLINKGDTTLKFKDSILGKAIKIFNITLLILFALNFVCWHFGMSEHRDIRIAEQFGSNQSSEEAEDTSEEAEDGSEETTKENETTEEATETTTTNNT